MNDGTLDDNLLCSCRPRRYACMGDQGVNSQRLCHFVLVQPEQRSELGRLQPEQRKRDDLGRRCGDDREYSGSHEDRSCDGTRSSRQTRGPRKSQGCRSFEGW